MKKLLNYAFAQAVSSFIPILMWFLISIVYGDGDYASVFTLTYSFQFVWALAYDCISGCIVWEKKHGSIDYDYTKSSILWSFLLLLSIALLAIVKKDYVFRVLGVTDSKYFYFYCFSLLCFCINLIIAGVALIQQYKGEEKKASLEMLVYYGLQVSAIVIVGALLKHEVYSILVTLCILLFYMLFVVVRNIKSFKLKFNIFIGIRYKIPNLISNVAVFLIYAFGLKSIVEVSALHLVSYNLMALSTDTQWDSLGTAIETDATITTCSGNYFRRKRELIRNAQWLSLILITSSVILMSLGTIMFSVDVKYIIILAILEISTFPLCALKYVYQSWLYVEHPGLPLIVVSLSGYIIRVIVSFSFPGAYALSLALLINSLYTGILTILYYKYKVRGHNQ